MGSERLENLVLISEEKSVLDYIKISVERITIVTDCELRHLAYVYLY